MIVVNKYKHTPTDRDVVIHRPSVLGNPYSHKTGTLAKYWASSRDEAVRLYEIWLRQEIKNKNPDVLKALNDISEDSNLVCFCKPQKCHGDIVIKILEEMRNVDARRFLTEK